MKARFSDRFQRPEAKQLGYWKSNHGILKMRGQRPGG
jgi:hypothetical protein